jgi:uncharacterized protein YhaN
MRIRAVYTDGFGCFMGRSFEFGEGLTLVVGPNEAGKTTLVRAIRAILFGQQASDRRDNAPWGGGAYAGTIELAGDTGTVRIRREFDSELVEITETENGSSRTWRGTANPAGRGPELEVYRERLKALVGFDDEDLFKSTLCVEQLAVELKVGSDIRARLTGPAQEDAEAVLERIAKRYEEVSNDRMRKGANPRLLQLCEQEIAEKAAQLEQTRGYFDEVNALRERDASLNERLEALTQDQQIDKRMFAEIDALAEARSEREALARKVPELAAERERTAGNLAVQKELTGVIASEYAGWETLPDDYGSMLLETARRRDDVARSRDDVERLEREAAGATVGARWVWLLVPVLVLAAAYAAGHFLGRLLPLVTIGGGVAAVLLVVLLVWELGRVHRRTRAARNLAAAVERYEGNQTSLKALGARLEPFVAGDDPEAEQKRYERYIELRQRLERVQGALESSRALPDVERQYHEKNAALDRAEGRLKELTETNPALKRFLGEEDPLREREQRRTEIERRASILDEIKDERTRVAADLRALTRKEIANEPTLKGEIDELKARRGRLAQRRDALGLASDVLGETITEYRAVHREALAGAIGALYARLTGGRYERVRLNEAFFPSLDGLGQQGLAVERVSQGARDQLYFAMRVAVAEELSGQVRLPFILDDAFVNFDDERLAAVYDVLHELAATHQFIVLTHSERERRFVERCIDLG